MVMKLSHVMALVVMRIVWQYQVAPEAVVDHWNVHQVPKWPEVLVVVLLVMVFAVVEATQEVVGLAEVLPAVNQESRW